MKKEVIITAKSLDEALEQAVKELSAPSADKIEYKVLEEAKKGFLGIGATDCKIEASYVATGADAAVAFLEKLIADMNLSATVTVGTTEEGEPKLSVEGEGAAILIGHHGETLDALQYLANLSANRKIDGVKREHIRVTVDVEGYRAKREETLRALARRMADKVLKYKKSVMLEPMNPYERRIIHSEVQKIEGVSTNSIGSDNNRKVVMYLESK